MPSSKSKLGRVLIAAVLVGAAGVIWLALPSSGPSPKPPKTTSGETSVKKAEIQKQREASAEGDARDASWIPFEHILLLAVVGANYLLLGVVAWSYWRGGRLDLGSVLSHHFQTIEAQLDRIERALRPEPPKAVTPPAPVIPEDPAPKAQRYEPPRVPTPHHPANEPVRRAPVPQEPPSLPARTRRVDESGRASKSQARDLVDRYCLVEESSIVDLGQQASALGLRIGSPSSTRGQRHVLDGPDHDSRLLAIRDDHEEVLLVVVGAGASVTRSEWLDLFEMRGFLGYCAVRSTRPALVNAVLGEVEEKGELEVLGPT